MTKVEEHFDIKKSENVLGCRKGSKGEWHK